MQPDGTSMAMRGQSKAVRGHKQLSSSTRGQSKAITRLSGEPLPLLGARLHPPLAWRGRDRALEQNEQCGAATVEGASAFVPKRGGDA